MLKISANFLFPVIIVLFIGSIGAVMYLIGRPEAVEAAPAVKIEEKERLRNGFYTSHKEMMSKPASKDNGASLDLSTELISATATEASGEPQEAQFVRDWSSFMRKWLSSINGGEWIYFSYHAELSGELGKDPFSEWMLPNNSLNEYWFKIDQNRNVVI